MNNKHLMTCFFALVFSFINVCNSYGEEREINMQYNGTPNDHYSYPIPADEPEVYYDDDDQEIIIDGTGYVTFYDVEITSTTNWMVYVTAQVNGSYDTIDISSLPQGEYVITIDSPTGNSFEGFFDTY